MKKIDIFGWLVLQDIAGYTTFSEKLRQEGKTGVEKLTSILNAFFTEQEEKIRQKSGFIFKLAGDAYFAALPPDTPLKILKSLLNSEVLNKYSLKSRVVAVRGYYSLNVLNTSYGKDVIPTGNAVHTLMNMEENTQGGNFSSLVQEGELGDFTAPRWLYKRKRHKNELVTYRPQVTGFLRVDTQKIEMVDGVIDFVKTYLPYVYVSKVVPYPKGFMVVLFYGYPVATGKEKELAVLSSLSIKDYLTEKVDFGIGLSYDYVYTGIVGGKYFKELTFIGDGINIAARLASMAKDNILLTEDIRYGLERKYEFEDIGVVNVKGKTKSIGVYNLLGKTDANGARRFVDREREQKMLNDRIDARKNIVVMAEAGVGKTTLLMHVLQNKRYKYLVIRGFPTQPPLNGVISLIKNLPNEIKNEYPLLVDLETGRKVEPEAIRIYLPQVLSKTLRESKVDMLVVDDLHWLDSISRDTVKKLVQLGLLMLGTMRSEYINDMDTSWFEMFSLEPFTKEATLEYMAVLLYGNVDEFLLNTVYDITHGVPFLVEQLVMYLKDRGLIVEKNGVNYLEEFRLGEVPKDAFSLLIARYDMLTPEEKVFVGYASLLGSEFKVKDILEVVPKKFRKIDMTRLVNLGFVVPVDEGVYTFRHALLREVIYAGILGIKRKFMHRRLARLFARKNYPPYMIALQYGRGGAWRKADEYWTKSFFDYLGKGFHTEAARIRGRVKGKFEKRYLEAALLQHYGKYQEAEQILLDLLPRAKKTRKMKLLLSLAGVYDLWEKYDRMWEVLKRLKSYEKYMKVEDKYLYLESLGIYYDMTGDKEKALDIYWESLKYATGDSEKATVFFNIGWVYFSTDRYKEAEKYLKKALTFGEDRLLRAWVFLRLGQIKLIEDKVKDAKKYLEQSFNDYFDSAFIYGINLVLHPILTLYMKLNDYDAVRGKFEKLREAGFLNSEMLAKFHIPFKFFGDVDNVKFILNNAGKNERIWIEVIDLLLDGHLEKACEKCRGKEQDLRICQIVDKLFKKDFTDFSDWIFTALSCLYCDCGTDIFRQCMKTLKEYKDMDVLAFFIWKKIVPHRCKNWNISY